MPNKLEEVLKERIGTIQEQEKQNLQGQVKDLQSVYQHREHVLKENYETKIKNKLESLQKFYVHQLKSDLERKAEFYKKEIEGGKLTQEKAQKEFQEYQKKQEAVIKHKLENEQKLLQSDYQKAAGKLQQEFQHFQNLLVEGAELTIQEKAKKLSEEAQGLGPYASYSVTGDIVKGKTPNYLGMVSRYIKKLGGK